MGFGRGGGGRKFGGRGSGGRGGYRGGFDQGPPSEVTGICLSLLFFSLIYKASIRLMFSGADVVK